MDLCLNGKNVLVTVAIAKLFAAEGANVAICARNAGDVGDAMKSLATKGV